MRKLAAITVIELILVMILASLVLGIGYYVSSVVVKQQELFLQKQRNTVLFRELNYQLHFDLDRASAIKNQEDSSIVLYTVTDTVIYQLKSGNIARKSAKINFEYPFELINVETISLSPSNELITQVSIHFKSNLNPVFRFEKHYSAQEILDYASTENSK